MSEDLNLISTRVFQGREYVLSLKLVASHTLDVKVTDKFSGEVWAGSYDCTYIENVTHKTGNYKQFDVFLSMLRSGFLKTSDSISLDLLSYEDLETLRSLRKGTASFYTNTSHSSNKRYLIVTYSVEFDRIHYPLPLDYCGPPNPLLLQATIRKLETEVSRLRDMLDKRNSAVMEDSSQPMVIRKLENKIKELTAENNLLVENIEHLTQRLSKKQGTNSSQTEMRRTLRILEEQVEQERDSFQLQVKELKNENQQLMMQLEECQRSESVLQEQLKLVQPPVQSKRSSAINHVDKRTRIRRNKYQLPPLPDRLPSHHVRGSPSPRGQMMGDGVNIRGERLLPKKPPPGNLSLPSSRRRKSSESSLTSCRSRSSSVESRHSRRGKRGGRTGEGKKTSSGGMRGKESPVSSKTSGKSSKPSSSISVKKPPSNVIRSDRSYHSSSDSLHSQYAATVFTRKRKTSRKKKVNVSNESKKSSSEIENRIRTLQKMLKESVQF
uniref:Coiled-coil domain-containing protein 61 n=1 Tax=Cacopsylla melanoneura TaxID=428564 RepID=A0A8D9E5J7_9HEMI